MFKLPTAALTSVGLVLTCVMLAASGHQRLSAAPSPVAEQRSVKGIYSPADRYNPALVVPGSGGEAVNLCLAAAKARGDRYGHTKNMDIMRIDKKIDGYAVYGHSLISAANNRQTEMYEFHCITRNGTVDAIRVSKL